jgi:hypothetical protein
MYRGALETLEEARPLPSGEVNWLIEGLLAEGNQDWKAGNLS